MNYTNSIKQDQRVLSYLDTIIIPLCRYPFTLIIDAIDRYHQSTKKSNFGGNYFIDDIRDRLELFEIRPDIAFDYFNSKLLDSSISNAISLVIEKLSYTSKINDIDDTTSRVLLLDCITVFVLFSNESYDHKIEVLFNCYNCDKSGQMNEMELHLFIYRLSVCLQKLHLLGAIDITYEDAGNIAFLARNSLKTANSIETKVCLSMQDFRNWILSSKEASYVFKFFTILNKLPEQLLEYKVKIENLDIISKLQYSNNNCSFPILPSRSYFNDKLKLKSTPPIRVYTSCMKSYFVIDSEDLPSDSIIYYRLMKFQVIENQIVKKLTYNKFQLNSYQSFKGISRVDISNLDPNSKYSIEMYSSSCKWKCVRFKTLDLEEKVCYCNIVYIMYYLNIYCIQYEMFRMIFYFSQL